MNLAGGRIRGGRVLAWVVRLVFVVLLLGVAGCGLGVGKDDKKQRSLESVVKRLQADARAVLEAAVPGTEVEMEESAIGSTRPCGGPVGTDMNKVRGQIEAAAVKTTTDIQGAARAGAAAAEKRGYETHDDELAGDYAEFGLLSGPANGSLRVNPSGRVTLSLETECLDNPDH